MGAGSMVQPTVNPRAAWRGFPGLQSKQTSAICHTLRNGTSRRVMVQQIRCMATMEKPRTKAALKDPARIGASAAVSVPVYVSMQISRIF